MSATPFLRLLPAFILGIGLQIRFFISWRWLLLLLLSALAGMLVWRFFPLRKQYFLRWVRSVWIYFFITCCGALLVSLKDVRHHAAYYGKILQGKDSLLVNIQEPLQARARSRKTIAAVKAIVRKGAVVPVKGKILLYFQQDSALAALACGDAVLLCGTCRPVSNSGNPGAFDYRLYCSYKQLFYQAYISTGHWKKLSRTDSDMADRYLLPARNWCIRTLQRYIGEGPAAALAEALLIGYRYDLDKDMVQAYTNAGVVHIIAISGMHLALIYTTLLWLLRWWPSRRFSNIAKAVLITGLLWGFALITGAAASILRAAVMFTAMAIGQLVLRRYSNTYNTLAASAFLVLCYDPWLLVDAGFQLSYLAVAGILLCYKPLYGLWESRYRILDKLWDAMALTLAAQLLTIPVCLYYFHQFPNLFLPANLLIVTLSTIILYALILLLLLSPLPVAAHYTGIVAQYLITMMNRLVLFIEGLPYAVTGPVYMPLYATVCAYMIITALLAVWLTGWKQGWKAALYACLLWGALYAADTIRALYQRSLIIYNVPAYTAIDVINGRCFQFAGDTALHNNSGLRQRYLAPTRLLYRAKEGALPVWRRQGTFISFGDKRMVIVDSTWKGVRPGKKFHTDYILLSHHPKLTIMQLKDMFVFKMIIFDASNPLWQIQQWKSDCSVLTLRCFSVPDHGAYLINF